MKKIITLFSIIILSFFFTGFSFAHPGRTDRRGCHTCKTNCKKRGLRYGQYHCHR